MYTQILNKCFKQDLIEIHDNLNSWKWDIRLGNKPIDWDTIPDHIFNNHHDFPTKYKITKPIFDYINKKVSEKELFKYHHLNNCNMTRLQHEIYWIKRQISKLFGIGFYSKKYQSIIFKILTDLKERDHKKWINETYGG